MEWVFICISPILVVEVFLHTSFKKNISEMLDFIKRSGKTIKSNRISDHWKEKILLHYSIKIFINSIQLFFCLILTASPLAAIYFLSKQLDTDLFSLLMTPSGFIISMVIASTYIVFRTRKKRTASDYNPLQRLLHYVALTNTSILEATLDAELAFCKTRLKDQSQKQHIFVSGLARGGTTILMRSLYESRRFASLTYADMPFVLAPNLWHKISRYSIKEKQETERKHIKHIVVVSQ